MKKIRRTPSPADNKDLAYYMALPYRVCIEPPDDDSDEWFATIQDLGCSTYADTYEGLLPMIEDAKRTCIEMLIEYGDPVPEPTHIKQDKSA